MGAMMTEPCRGCRREFDSEFIREHERGCVFALRDELGTLRAERDELLEKCRRALRAERAYREVLHARVGSRYGAERRDRELAAARAIRDRAAAELGL